jgi:hypothetical protein
MDAGRVGASASAIAPPPNNNAPRSDVDFRAERNDAASAVSAAAARRCTTRRMRPYKSSVDNSAAMIPGPSHMQATAQSHQGTLQSSTLGAIDRNPSAPAAGSSA